MKKLLFKAAVVVFGAMSIVLASGVPRAFADWELVRIGTHAEIGCLPPEFKLAAPDGTAMDITAFRGQVILLTFCSGYTDACCTLVQTLNNLLDVYESRGVVAPLVISELPASASRTMCARLTSIIGSRFPTMIDEELRAKRAFGVKQLPTTFVIGRDFCIRDRVLGRAVFYTPEFRASLEALLAEKP